MSCSLPALAPTSVDLTVNINKVKLPQAAAALTNYYGRPLFFRAQSNGTVLSIVIGDEASISPITSLVPTKMPPATTADVTFLLEGAAVANWPGIPVAFDGTASLKFTASLDSQRQVLHLAVDDIPALPFNDATMSRVRFVLVQQPDGDYLVQWIAHDTILVQNSAAVTTGSVVLPVNLPGHVPGSVMGPMGFSTP
jgi:hypothetical protein